MCKTDEGGTFFQAFSHASVLDYSLPEGNLGFLIERDYSLLKKLDSW